MEECESRRRFIVKAATAATGLSFGMSALPSCHFERNFGANKIKVNRSGRLLVIELPVSEEITRVEIRLFSAANNKIIEYSDVSPFAPQAESAQTGEVFDPDWGKKEEKDRQANRELRFPVVDLVVSQGMEAVFEIDQSGAGEYCFNGNFYPEMQEIDKEIHIPFHKVEHWENALLLDPKSNSIRSFFLLAKADVTDSKVNFEFETLRDDWEGSIWVYNTDNKELIASTDVSSDEVLPSFSTGSGVNRERTA